MQIQEFAERVLLSTTLEDKLTPPPADLTDTRPGTAISTPPAPGRPESLTFQPDGIRAEVPSFYELKDDAHRGRLLHFFANHELLATELMALVLLKFPDAPKEFRAGIVKTLKEEQMHTKLYMKRMDECGVTFGDQPLNGFFWKCVGDMETPLDYVTRLSLTFEQANLDFSRHFAGVFKDSGDNDTAKILQRIYEDEINHVHYGLTWFRKWKNQSRSDWDSYSTRLPFPLTPSRAKGTNPFNEEGRRAAGLDEEFITKLRISTGSSGRSPDLYQFNPAAESEAAGETPPSALGAIAHDLAILPAFLAGTDDLTLVPEIPGTAHLESLHSAGIALPSFTTDISDHKFRNLLPWAWTPKSYQQFDPPFPQPDPALYSKATDLQLIEAIHENAPDQISYGAFRPQPVTRDTIPQHRPLILKAPFSTAGRDRILLTTPETNWIEGHETLIAEPWLERIADFSIQYEFIPGEHLVRKGFVHLENSKSGTFRAASVTPRFSAGHPTELRRFLHEGKKNWFLHYLKYTIEPALINHLTAHNHQGAFGIDAFFFKTEQGQIKLRPLVELNPRFTMGRIALGLARHAPERYQRSTLAILPKKQPLPPGAIALNDPAIAKRFIATWEVK